MANLSERDKNFLTNVYSKGYDAEKAFSLLNKARAKNGLPEVKKDGKTAEFFTGIGKGLYNVGSQLSRLKPGDQSADPNSYYNRSQALMQGADVERRFAGQDPESMTSKAGQFVGETLPTIPLSMGIGALAGAGTRGLASVAPKVASKIAPFTTLPTKASSLGNVMKFGALEGAKDQAIYDKLTTGETSLKSIAIGAGAGSLLGAGFRGASKMLSKDIPINTSKAGAYTEPGILGKAADNLSTKFNRIDPTKEIDFQKMTGETVGQFLNKRGINEVGSGTVDKLSDLFQKSINEADDGLALIKGKFKMTNGDDFVGVALDDLTKKLHTELSPQRGLIDSLSAKYASGGLTQTEINSLKRLYQQNNKFGYLKEAIDPTGVARATNILDGIRDWQFKTAGDNGFTNLNKINKNTQAYKFLTKEIQRKIDKASGNNAVSITDWIVATGSPYGLPGVIGKKLVSSDTAKSLLLKGLNKGRQTIEPLAKASKDDIIKAQVKKVYGLSNNDYSDLSFSSTMDRKGLKALPSPSGKPLTNSGVIDVKPVISGPRGANPSDVTGRSKIVAPKGYNQKLETLQLPPGKSTPFAGTKTFDAKPIIPGAFPDPTITSRSKIVKPGTYTEMPVKNEVQAVVPKSQPKAKLRTNEDALKKAKTPQEGKTPTRGLFGGVEGVKPANQAKFNQGDSYEAVRVIMNDKDARIVRYGAIRGRGLKKGFTTADNAEMKGILDELKITREEAINRSEEIKRLAREARSSKEEVILDLTKEKPVETKPTPKPESKLPKTPQEGKTAGNSWKELQDKNPDLFNKGILRRSKSPMDAEGIIPDDVHSAQGKWHNLGQNSEVPAKTIYKRIDSGAFKGEYEDMLGNPIRNSDGSILQDVYDDATGEWIEPMVSNKELKNHLLDSFSTKEGKKYLNEVIDALPKDKNGMVTAYRIGTIGEGTQSYTLSEGLAKTFSHQGTDIPLPGTPYLPAKGYEDFGVLPSTTVKIDPKGIKAWSPYDAEILVEGKYVNPTKPKHSLPPPQEGKTVDAQQISDKIQNSFVNNPGDKLAKADRLQGKGYSYKEAKTGLTQTGKDIPGRIEIGRNGKGELEILDGRHLLEAYREKGIKIPNDKIKFRDGVTIEDLTKKKSSLPLSQKSEVKYSKPDLVQEAKKYKSAEEFVKKEAIRKRLIDEGTKINPDDTVTLYHATYNKGDILKQGEFKGTRAAPGGMVGVDLGDNIVYFGTDKKWVQDTWSSSGTRDIIEIKVPLEYIRKPAQNKLEVYFEGGLKRKGDIWIPGVKPQSTHYDKIAEMTLLTDKEKQQLLDIYNKANKK